MFPSDAWEIAAKLSAWDPHCTVDRHHPASNALGYFPDLDGAYSWCRSVLNVYDTVIVLPGCRLIDTNWSRDWLWGLSATLRDGGQLLIPYRTDGLPSEPAGLVANQLNAMFGAPQKVTDGFASFSPKYQKKHFQSVVGHVMSDAFSWIGRLAEYRSAELKGSLEVAAWRMDFDDWFINENSGLSPLSADFMSETFEDFARYIIYSVQGINSKSYSLANVFKDIFGSHQRIRWSDLGSGSGFLGIELASRFPLHVFNIDKSLAQTRLGIDMIKCLGRLRGRCSFITSRLEQAELPDRLDAITMITTLCYLPKQEQWPLLKRCWEALNPGGALIIYENIRSTAYKRDFNIMFNEIELDKVLATLGSNIGYYHALTGRRISKQMAAGKTCYRVVIKQ